MTLTPGGTGIIPPTPNADGSSNAEDFSRHPVSNVSTPVNANKTPIKTESSTSTSTSGSTNSTANSTPGMSQKKRLLAKAQSEWILGGNSVEVITTKQEPNTGDHHIQDKKFSGGRSSSYEYLDNNSAANSADNSVDIRAVKYERGGSGALLDDRDIVEEHHHPSRSSRHYYTSHSHHAHHQHEQQQRAAALLAAEREDRMRLERERERIECEERLRIDRERLERAELDYQARALAAAARERDLVREHLVAATAAGAAAAAGSLPRLELTAGPPLAHQAAYDDVHHRNAVEYIQPPAAHTNRDILAVHRSNQHFAHNSPTHESLYAPATVYVTAAAGYQQIAFPPPAHHARPVLPPPMQSAAAAAVFQHPQLHPQYGYAPLSPGKTRYLY